jgi:hypothetical protein
LGADGSAGEEHRGEHAVEAGAGGGIGSVDGVLAEDRRRLYRDVDQDRREGKQDDAAPAGAGDDEVRRGGREGDAGDGA